MDGVSSEANEENDNVERPVRRRHSSILKPPRSPLQDLRGGNETVWESYASRTRKSSRRVSFADTIKVFQTESQMKTVRKSEISETEAGENVTIQNKNSDDSYCEITGMNTLLCAPIQTQIQQKEFPIVDHNQEKKHANDQTVIFSDENQMDLTASHTVMITKGLSDYTKSESSKIDTTSFLANLKWHTENSRIKKELKCSITQNTSSEKINSNDFIERLKTGKYSTSKEPDKENSQIPIYSRESNSISSTHQIYIPLNVDDNSTNRTRIFKEQDDEMNFTQCHTTNIQTLALPSSEANLGEFKSDTTIYGNELMELTINHTTQVLPSENSLSETENQTQNVMTDVTVGEAKTPEKAILKNKLNAAFQESFSNPQHKIQIAKTHTMGSASQTVTQTQDARTLGITSESMSSNPASQSYKTIFYSSCNDAMELTKCLSSMREEKNLLKPVGNYSKICTNPDASPLLIDKTIYPGEDSMDITKSHTIAIDNKIFKQDQESGKKEISTILLSEKHRVLQSHVTMSEDGKMNVNYISVPQPSKERLQQSLPNTLSISLNDKKTELLAGEDMDLTETHTSNLRNQATFTTFDPASKNVTKSYSHSKIPSDEWDKMIKSLTQPSQQPNLISKNILTDTQDKKKHQILKISSCLDKDSPLSADYNQNIAKNHNTSCHVAVLDNQAALVQGQHFKLSESQRQILDDPTPDCAHKMICSEEEQTIDLTKSHTVVIGFGPSEVQEDSKSKTNLEHRTCLLTTVSRQIAVNVEESDKSPIEKTGIINDMAVLEDGSVRKPEFLKEKQNIKIYERKSTDGIKIDKVVFSEGEENDMDITKSYTVEINHRSFLGKHDSHLIPSAGTSKTILYACEQDEMEITRSNTTALDCKIISPVEITTRPLNKTVMFVDNHDELEMTKSHTVFIDYQAEEKSILRDQLDFELPKKKSLQNPKVMSTPAENSECNHPAAKGSSLTVLEEESNSGPREETNITDISKLTTWKSVKDVQKPGFLNEPLSGKNQRRKSLRLKNNRTVTFPEDDKNDTDTSSMVEVNKIALEDREDCSFMPLAETSKPILCACGQDDLEPSRSHTTASEYNAPPDEITTKSMDKTVMFVDNLNDLDVTKSHTVFIDCQAMEKILHEYTQFGIARSKNLSIPKGDTCIQEITKNQAVAEQEHHMTAFIPTNTLSNNQSKMEIIKFHKADKDEEDIGKDMDQVYTLKQAEIESCPFNRADGRNMDVPTCHKATVCGPNDSYSYLPNVTSFDNLEENVTSSCDKNKEKANCQVPNELVCGDLSSEYSVKSERLPLIAPCPLKEEVIQTNCAITLVKNAALIKEPQNQTLVYSQNQGVMSKFNSKCASYKFTKDEMEAFVNDTTVASQPHLSSQQPKRTFTLKGQSTVNKVGAILSKAGNKASPFLIGNSSPPTCENESERPSNEKHFAVVYTKELNESVQTAKCNIAIDCHSNSDLTTPVIQTHANAREASASIVPTNASCFSSIKPTVSNLNRKTERYLDFQSVSMLTPEKLPELGSKRHDNMSIVQVAEIHNLASSDAKDNRDKVNNSHNGAEITSVPLKTAIKGKMKRCSLGIFLPRWPKKRNCSVTGVDDLKQIPTNKTDLTHLETQPVTSKESVIGSITANLNLSPSQYINEENLPIDPGEINSSDSVSIEIEEKSSVDTNHKEILPFENKMEETFNTQKRTWGQEDDDVPNEKKIRKFNTQDHEIFDHHAEGDIDKNVNSVLTKSLSRTPSSCSSSLDSIKADGISLDFSTHRNSQMESQFLGDSICEESLREKLKDGRITIREFFILLQVHILIQKPRQSNLPAKFTINTSPTPEDLMLRQYVYRPMIQIYREDYELLRQKIEELKVSALNQDKLLIDVNKNLWEKMKNYSDEELKNFGIYLNKLKSCYTKMTKIFTHQGKVALYSKLVHSAQNEKEKLQIKINEMDNILKKINNCLTEVEIETKNLESEEKGNLMEEWDSEMRAAEKELEQLKTEEEELQRKLLEVELQKEQTLAQIKFIQKQTNVTKELLDRLSLSEWDVIEWSDDQAIFTFVYDTIELIITFGEPVVGLPFLDKAYKKIDELNFQSLLDEDKAPPSSRLVHKLIFQYIEEQESWKKKCKTQHQVPQMLQELSLVVNHCKLLGEEIEFLKRWGPNYNLMDIDVNNTELRLLFSSFAAFAKFEIILSLSAHYPLVLLPFTIQNHLGDIGHDQIATIISKVPLENNYLKNVVKHIYQDLLKDCHFYQKTHGPQL
ncbi:kinetochore scaffold 1 [Nannospalax galili]|uniref:kinetochore scaffold 1 n=1 Tax=Nannospalax galili TaxID=1026970 RepID=UPI00111C2C5D|nr:kinetochore scaffold 1 [Nannospalax galili]XP_029426113.1 kinetochore scaffold 1 [Nannospalax galili]XP_029426114.1 kinetochore scaffold 1 [Nannospalax galili]XP_029426115.1 kinetochore scaffold 1 [Nannospalax galili]